MRSWELAHRQSERDVEILLQEDRELSNQDLMGLSGFLMNWKCLQSFLNSSVFNLEVHIPWLKNIFRLTCKVAYNLDGREHEFSSVFLNYVNETDSNQFIELIASNVRFREIGERIRDIINDHIDWVD